MTHSYLGNVTFLREVQTQSIFEISVGKRRIRHSLCHIKQFGISMT